MFLLPQIFQLEKCLTAAGVTSQTSKKLPVNDLPSPPPVTLSAIKPSPLKPLEADSISELSSESDLSPGDGVSGEIMNPELVVAT